MIIVAIDGPSGVGKSSTSRAVARRLAIPHIDTGAMYRAVALRVIEAGIDPSDEIGVVDLASRTTVDFETRNGENEVVADGENVAGKIRTPEVSLVASTVSAHPGVRRRLVALQQEIGRRSGGVLEGRDIGTKVFPDTPHKFFLTASPEVRAGRRWRELKQKGVDASLEEVLSDQERRDRQDSTRVDSPLTVNETYRVIDTSEMTVEEVVDVIVESVGDAG
ncbi:MAG: (d)CMP kinase [Acidobacteria bacterium]|nr:(d)CMP kinase [Acidobacteriota bacterium]